MKKLLIITILFNTSLFAAIQTIHKHKGKIWGISKIDENNLAYTSVDGGVFLLDLKTKKSKKIQADFPGLLVAGQGGLLDIHYYKEKLYFTYSFKNSKGNTTRVVSFDYKNEKLTNFKVIFTSKAFETTTHHYGSRIYIEDDMIYFTIGDRGKRDKAQSLKYHNGSILRININGSIPKSNPFKESAIYSYGHRNSQGITSLKGAIYNGEFGPQGGDEINLIKAGSNYGWPIITYGEEYGGGKIGKKITKGLIQPLKYWVPSLSFSDIIFKGNKLYLACLGTEQIVELELVDGKFKNQIKVSGKLKERFRTLEVIGNTVYFATDSGTIGLIK